MSWGGIYKEESLDIASGDDFELDKRAPRGNAIARWLLF